MLDQHRLFRRRCKLIIVVDGPDRASRSVAAVLAVPKESPPPSTATIVEFYHAALDHYFITGIAQEISDLDTGVHSGWARTGQTFKAIEEALERDKFLTADAARDFGIVDKVIEKRPEDIAATARSA